MAFYTLDLQFYQKKWAKRKKEMTPFYGKKTEEKQNSADIMISVDGEKDSFSSEVKITRGIVWIKILKKKKKEN